MIMRTQQKKRGVVLLIAVLVSTVALSVGLGVYNRTYKELLFSSFWKQAQVAFAAADAGLECALYWDLHPAVAPVSCLGFTVKDNLNVNWNPTLNATVELRILTPLCVTVNITKNAVYPFTTIESRGYNTCDTSNPRRVERGLRIDY